jgi:hypothetical protein
MANIPKLSFPDGEGDSSESDDEAHAGGPTIVVQSDEPQVPTISVMNENDPVIAIDGPEPEVSHKPAKNRPMIYRGNNGLACGGCTGPLMGRVVHAMGVGWHPGCFRCCECNESLEHVSSYEHEGRAYCHLDYHEVGCDILARGCFVSLTFLL